MPEPTSPVLAGFEDREVVYAKDQPEYKPLPVLRSPDGKLLSRWSLTQEEREALANGGDLFLYVHTFNQPLQPSCLIVAECGADVRSLVVFMDLDK